VNCLEVLQGMRNKAELLAVKKMLDKRSARLLPLTEAITLRASEMMESLTFSHGLQTGDALIAATAIEHQLPVLTATVKHFGAVQSLIIEAFVP
jgi:predicted nucleic acid-binding protein